MTLIAGETDNSPIDVVITPPRYRPSRVRM
jgi:hypothetical protein